MTKSDRPNSRSNHRPSKKTEMLEVRVSPEEKAAFLDTCKNVGRSASEVIRDAMRAYSNFGPMARLPGSPLMLVSSFAGAAAGVFVIMQIVGTDTGAQTPRLIAHQDFQIHDYNNDHVLTRTEYRRSFGEFRAIFADGELRADGQPDQANSRRLGIAMGMVLVGRDINILPFITASDTISDGCWRAIDTAYVQQVDIRFGQRDLNNDGQVTLDEYGEFVTARNRSRFNDTDRNSDGVLTVEDLVSQPRNATPARRDEPGYIALCRADVGGRGSAQSGPMGTNVDLARSQIASWDLNGNLSVDFDEYVTALLD